MYYAMGEGLGLFSRTYSEILVLRVVWGVMVISVPLMSLVSVYNFL